jgi:histidine triad (HIT) family protein
MTTIFGKIIRKEAPADIVFESENIIAFKDVAPAAPVHLLIVPKKQIATLQAMAPEDYHLLTEVVQVAQQLAKEFNCEEGYRLLTNVGSPAGQTVFHLHFHLLGGRSLGAIG